MDRFALIATCLASTACSACGGGGPSDGSTPVDIDNGTCGAQIRFTGEFVDWDDDTKFCGIFDAKFQVQGGGTIDSTAPNGRFDFCIPDQPITLIDVTPPSQPSQCTAPQGGVYAIPAIAVANKDVIFAGGFWSGRAFPTGRVTVDTSKAHVFVHVNGTPHAVSITASHGATQANATGTWQPNSTTGRNVFIQDVDPTGGSTMLAVEGGAVGTGSIPLVAGKVTMVAVVVK